MDTDIKITTIAPMLRGQKSYHSSGFSGYCFADQLTIIDVHENCTAVIFAVRLHSAHNFSGSVWQNYSSVQSGPFSSWVFAVLVYRSSKDFTFTKQQNGRDEQKHNCLPPDCSELMIPF